MRITRILFFLSLLACFSCQSYKFTYLQPPLGSKDSIYNINQSDYHIQPADIIYVRVSTLDEKINALMNPSMGSSGSSLISGSSGGGMYLTQYSVNKEGEIILPVVGTVKVGGLTIVEARQEVANRVKTFVNDAITDVKLVSFKVSLLGEVRSAGQVTVFNDKASIFEVLALSGDMSYNANRENVSIIRTENNKTRIIKVNLTRRDILTSNLYYLQPNDIIYVEPLKSTVFRLRVADYSVFLTLITSTVSVFLLVMNLSK